MNCWPGTAASNGLMTGVQWAQIVRSIRSSAKAKHMHTQAAGARASD